MGLYFDNAATSFPKPEAVYRAVDGFLREGAANPGRSGHRMAVAAAGVVARCRQRLARLLGAPDPARVVFTPGCTEALNLALKGWVRPGDRVVTTSLEHNAVARPLVGLAERGVAVARTRCPGGRFDLAAFREALGPGARLAVVTHASNVTGEVLPLEAIAAACRERAVPLLVDAAQTAGSLCLDAAALGVAFMAVPGHKGLLGPPGVGALYIADGYDPEPLVEGGTGTHSQEDEQPLTLPDRYESGTPNGPAIAGLDAALAWIEEMGMNTIRRCEDAWTGRLWEGLAGIEGVTLHGPPPGGERAAVVTLSLDGWDPQEAALVLDERFDIQCRAGLHCAPWAHASLGTLPGGTLRLAPGFFNTRAECEAVVAAVRELAAA